MTTDLDDTEFEPQIGRAARDRGPTLTRLRSAIRIAGRAPRSQPSNPSHSSPRTGVRAHFRKGATGTQTGAQLAQRRVVVKARFVSHAGALGAPIRMHVSYLAREGRAKSLEAAPAQDSASGLDRSVDYLGRSQSEDTGGQYAFYNQHETALDAKGLTAAWVDDARHFRLIISPEDGEALGELQHFAREIMAGLEQRLGTKLEWLAVDHRDTDNPHTHVLIRGRRSDGQDLFIPSRLISSGIREHAQEIATRILGPRQDVDLVQERGRDIATKGVSPLDRELLRRPPGGPVGALRSDLAARLERLQGWGLAQRSETGWRLSEDLLGKLQALERSSEIEAAVGVMRRRGDHRTLLAADPASPALGELMHFGPIDALGESFLAVIETERGELRYATFDRSDDLARLADAPTGAIVGFVAAVARVRPSDEAVARVASKMGGRYSADLHGMLEPAVSADMISANVRRLEAMRRAGLVERGADGTFAVGPGHLTNALKYEERVLRRSPMNARVASYWTLEEQVTALGPTHLDKVLTGVEAAPAGAGGYAQRHAAFLQQRRMFLIEQGVLGGREQVLPHEAFARMGKTELRRTALALSKDLGRTVLTEPAARVQGVYARRVDLAQGRMALIVGERSVHLVPWRSALERFAGREVEGALRGRTLSWSLARSGPSLPPM